MNTTGKGNTGADSSDPFAGLADGYSDDLELEEDRVETATSEPVKPPPEPAAGPPKISPAMLEAMLAALPDAVKDAMHQNDAPDAVKAAMHQNDAPDAVKAAMHQNDAPEGETSPVVGPPRKDLAPAPASPVPQEEVGIELDSVEVLAETPSAGKLKGLLGRIRGRSAADIAKPGGSSPTSRVEGNSTKELEAAQAEVEALKKKLLQLQGETVSFRKRISAELKQGKLAGREDVFEAIITVFDSLSSALASGAENREFESFYSGVEMIDRQFHQVLGNLGLTATDALGESFDPKRHEAMRMVETGSAKSGVVIEQLRMGYFVGDKLLRPALVIVEK